MPSIEFTPNLKRHVECPSTELDATSVAEFLEIYFARWPGVRGFALDDQGAIRQHVKILVDGKNIRDRRKSGWTISRTALLGDPIAMLLPEADGKVTVAQSLGHFGVKIKRSIDAGESFDERPVPVYPEQPEGVVEMDPVHNKPIHWDLKPVWSLETGGAEGRKHWMGGGAEYPGIHSVMVDSHDSNTLRIGVS